MNRRYHVAKYWGRKTYIALDCYAVILHLWASPSIAKTK
jgi:hypothetical protein